MLLRLEHCLSLLTDICYASPSVGKRLDGICCSRRAEAIYIKDARGGLGCLVGWLRFQIFACRKMG